MKYEFVLENNCFLREEAPNVFTLMLRKTGFQLQLNKVGKYIYELVRKYNETDNILNDMYNYFPHIDKRLIQSDFNDLFDLMVLYNIVKIDYPQSNPIYTETPAIRFAGDGDYTKVCLFLKEKSKLHKVSTRVYQNTENINPVSLRYTSFRNINYYCCAFDDNEEVIGLIVMEPPTPNLTVAVIDGLIFAKTLKDDELIKLSGKMFKVILRRFVTLTKFRVNILSNSEQIKNRKFIDLINKLGFYKEAELKKESNDNTLFIYSKPLFEMK